MRRGRRVRTLVQNYGDRAARAPTSISEAVEADGLGVALRRRVREELLVALDVLAVDLLERLAEAESTGRQLPRTRELRQLHDALVATATAARKLDDRTRA